MNYQNIDMNFTTLSSNKKGLKDHYHNGYELIFITEGNSKFVINGSNYDFSKNCLVFINNVEKHKMYPINTPYSRYMIIIDSDYLDSVIKEHALLSIFKIRPKNFNHGFNIRNEDAQVIKSLLNNLYNIYINKNILWHVEFISMLSSLLILIYRNYTKKFPIMNVRKPELRIFEIQRYIDKNFKKNITLDSISSDFYINKYYLSHSFKDITGFTIKQYILLNRIAHAKNQLYYTDNDITTIALNSGFNSQSNFIRLFKKKENTTPLQFRKHFK
ncbi:helix-turn-helix transcriptional regulator [Clostridium sp. D2Q-14]|uniref:AraC family transcriptional regulator n=1 Tax=Anaeromonas gelatinilytica TaxID=2683194 RepID=UPI00193BF2A5|nr:AraC family transcriptional regulator [Anaeromonas gelatinilytica]MBS4535064.1 helix-turn-helix transcriptional regulator [Anaeromonas gelatinilytica]